MAKQAIERITGAAGEETDGATPISFSLYGLLDSFIFQGFMLLIFIIGAIILMSQVTANSSLSKVLADLFYAFGVIATAMNIILFFWIIISTFRSDELKVPTRTLEKHHLLHSFSIITSLFTFIWALYALIVTFGSILVDTPSNLEVVGWLMVLISGLYSGFLLTKHGFGLGAITKDEVENTVQGPATLDANGVLALIRANAGQQQQYAPAAAPLGGGFGAPFGGVDLSALLPSTITSVKGGQGENFGGGGGAGQNVYGQYPMMWAAPQPCFQTVGCQPSCRNTERVQMD